MGVTWEQARLLHERHGLFRGDAAKLKQVQSHVRSVMRSHGVRIANAEKNTGKAKYCFNRLQRSFFPEELQNPQGTGGGGVT